MSKELQIVLVTALVGGNLAVWVYTLRFFRNDPWFTFFGYDYPTAAGLGFWWMIAVDESIVGFLVVFVIAAACLFLIRRRHNGPRPPRKKRRRLAVRKPDSIAALRKRLGIYAPLPA